ncbi:unnamed protein product [Meganyctiphanes norvegica]|uniref:Uncharacterized protein n=1 Tax=Meganyctiphanes norvegica TaxID=48144 RepID=A0AAV2PJJ6_MEGNR
MWAAVALCLSLTHASVLVQDASGPCDPRGCLGLETGKSGTCYAPDEGHTDDTVPEESADCNGDCICWVPIIGKISPLQSFSHLPQLPSEHGNSNEGDAIHCTGKETGKVGYCYNADDIHTTDTIPESSDDCTANTTCWVPIVGAGSVDFGTFVREDGRADISIVRMKQLVRESGEAGTGFTIASPDMEANATGIKLIMYYPTYKETVQVNFTGEEKQIEFNVDVLNPDNGIPSGNSSIIWIEISAFDDPESLMPIAEGHVEFVLPDADADFIATWVGEEGTDATPCLRVVPGTKDVMINGVGTCLSTEDVCYYLEDKDILAVSTCKLVENIAAQLPTEPNSQVSVCPAEDPDQYVATPGDTILELNGTNLAVTSTVEGS